jgi:hypothetical protein
MTSVDTQQYAPGPDGSVPVAAISGPETPASPGQRRPERAIMRRVARHFPLPANRVSGRLSAYRPTCQLRAIVQRFRRELMAHPGMLDFAAARENVDRNVSDRPGRLGAISLVGPDITANLECSGAHLNRGNSGGN